MGRDRSGEGALVDVSELEAAIVSTAPWSLALAYEGAQGFTAAVHAHHRDRPTFYEAADGKVMAGFGRGPFWVDAMHVLGLEELADDRFSNPVERRAHLAAIRPRIEQRVAKLSRWEVFESLATVRSKSGVVQDVGDLLENPHLEARGYFVETELGGRALRMPGAPAKLSATPWELHRPAPNLAETGGEPTGPSAGAYLRQVYNHRSLVCLTAMGAILTSASAVRQSRAPARRGGAQWGPGRAAAERPVAAAVTCKRCAGRPPSGGTDRVRG